MDKEVTVDDILDKEKFEELYKGFLFTRKEGDPLPRWVVAGLLYPGLDALFFTQKS
ncbi:hypothetical protein UFOVP1288_27 [uncultured Caudovirales phage]|uniref:Uncharacterized protein n=1 Tax=uncultured Caudovirales phage TaxID=2100421 RepID=A0A6J5QZD9_9CAUD|nr:hypothetical protein UFOVP1195_27 [uncultured Caudovirales phage]CAB4195606.1 hypothetical protein UFOVP1288_27 [uncultured Caudovirales phage]CAB4204935.1 hypothetical protein UFOVP1409_27 [uncultured Caudovirales phage]